MTRIGKTVTYDGQDLPEWVIVRNTPLQLGAPIEWSLSDIPGRPGAIPVRRKTGVRRIPIDITIDAKDHIELKQRAEILAGMLVRDKEKPLQISDEPDRTYYALFDELVDFSKSGNLGEGQLIFKAARQPYKEGPGQVVEFNDTVTFPYLGTAESWPIIMVNFSATTTDYEIENQEGKKLTVLFEFSSGDELVINTKNGKVLINGEENKQALHLSSRWFPLEPGENILTVNTDTAAQTTTVGYNEMYL
ncbi:putative phage tail component-like protein [Melghiribacillus thermohalophilus]|uniref:Putative phage tail component-like protein n=1 Tax=Melghiribacillus thermohalophilus TaxID=1324956 RepID=A0A4R3N5N4_9BACI|nr:distal tail protein Dit [Melghiribacillus thermohalophilus]TCT23396.1 putative phage tail component-like protein [Melghiribacillus thermohalophilus]